MINFFLFFINIVLLNMNTNCKVSTKISYICMIIEIVIEGIHIYKQNMSIYKNFNLDTNWKDPMIPIENNNVNHVYNSKPTIPWYAQGKRFVN